MIVFHQNTQPETISVCLFFTLGVSLRCWKNKGLYQREITPYLYLAREQNVKISLLTYGGLSDLEFQKELEGINILPVFRTAHGKRSKLVCAIAGPLAVVRYWSELTNIQIFKSNQMLGSHVALFASRLFNGRFFLRTGYDLLDFTRRQKRMKIFEFFAWILSYLAYRFANLILVATEEDKKRATQLCKGAKKKILVQPNWVDTKSFSPKTENTNSKHDLITVARLEKQKNLPNLIIAAHKLGFSLDIVGTGTLKSEREGQDQPGLN